RSKRDWSSDVCSSDLRGYIGLITKTPTHGRWRTAVWAPEPYDLDELRDWLPDDLPMPRRIKKSEAFGYGRNVSLFESLRQWAYQIGRASCRERGCVGV